MPAKTKAAKAKAKATSAKAKAASRSVTSAASRTDDQHIRRIASKQLAGWSAESLSTMCGGKTIMQRLEDICLCVFVCVLFVFVCLFVLFSLFLFFFTQGEDYWVSRQAYRTKLVGDDARHVHAQQGGCGAQGGR